MNRVFVSGLGVATPVGLDLDSFWQGLVSDRNAFSEVPALPGVYVGAIRQDLNVTDLPARSLAACDRNAVLALSAARSALADAGLAAPWARPDRIAVVIGNGAGGLVSVEDQHERLFAHGKRPHPHTIVKAMVSAAASWVSMAFRTSGPCFATSSACASATQAIGTAAALIRSGIVDIAIAGGTEAPLATGAILAWEAMKVMSHDKCRPFCRTRDGLMISEGAGIVVLEAEAHARARGATPDIEVAGFCSNADFGDIVAPTADGMARAMNGALSDAGLPPHSVSYVNAHGTGTCANDATETEAMKRVFGAEDVPPVSSTKGITGHALGAAGGIEAVATVLAMRKSIAPPTANFQLNDKRCDIDVIPNIARAMPIEVALSNSFAFGGLNASIAFRRHI